VLLLERIEDEGLAQYSYVVGSRDAAEVAVVDPRRDIDVYLDWSGLANTALGLPSSSRRMFTPTSPRALARWRRGPARLSSSQLTTAEKPLK